MIKWDKTELFDDDEVERDCFKFVWYRSKTYNGDELAFLPHASNWLSCCIHSLATHAALLASPSEYMFPSFHNLKHSMSHINDEFRSIEEFFFHRSGY